MDGQDMQMQELFPRYLLKGQLPAALPEKGSA